MAFASIRESLKFPALLRAYSGQDSSGAATYLAPTLIRCYPAVENVFVANTTGGAVASKTVLYVSADVTVKEQDIIIFENASANWFGKVFSDNTERNNYYTKNSTRLIADKTWCCVGNTAQFWNGTAWITTFDGNKVDGEISGGFQGKTNTVKSVPKYFDGFGWDNDAENDDGLSIQEISL